MRFCRVLFLVPALIALSFGQEPKTIAYPTTRAGKQVEAYVKAFNAGETTMREYLTGSVSKEDLQKLSLDERMNRYLQMHGRLGNLELRKVTESTDDRLSGLFHGSNGNFVDMTFMFQKSAPYGLLGIRVEDAGRGEEKVSHEPKKNNAELIDAVQKYATGLEQEDKFSGVVLIAENNKPVFQKAYGYADREKKIPNTIEARFNIGSINKSFTHLAIDQLEAAGKLSYSDPIGKFLPDYPNKEAAEKVTVRELLDMTSGIGDFFGERYQTTPKQKLRTLEAYLPLFADKPLEFPPGSKWRYSNGGFVVLGLIVQKASGMDYYDYVWKHIFEPAGMKRTGSFEKDSLPADCARGYTRNGDSWKSNYETLPERGSSAGGGYSTVHDLLKYTIALGRGTITAKGVKEQAGMGIAGGAPGLNAALDWSPRSGYTVIVMSNFDPPTAMAMARQINAWLPAAD